MKKILLACFFMIVGCTIHAQNIDKFVLGEKRAMSVCHVPTGFKYVSTGKQNVLEYTKQSGPDIYTTYRMTFKNGNLYDLEKISCSFCIEGVSSVTPEQEFMDAYTDLIEQFAPPSNQMKHLLICIVAGNFQILDYHYVVLVLQDKKHFIPHYLGQRKFVLFMIIK